LALAAARFSPSRSSYFPVDPAPCRGRAFSLAPASEGGSPVVTRTGRTEDVHVPLPFCQKLLIVEDNPDTRYGLLLLLAGAGYEADAVANGQEALDYLHAVRELPRLILLDLRMPVMDGWQFLRARARDAAEVGIPVLVVTAEPATDAAALGAEGIVVKPVNEATLLEEIGRHYWGGGLPPITAKRPGRAPPKMA
jgi:CheY-like chemotaxis protein